MKGSKRSALFNGALGIVFVFSVLAACSGEDRSGEMPRVPVVKTVSGNVAGDSCVMTGFVSESHNSSMKECGFVYGNTDSTGAAIKLKTDTMRTFSAVADSLANGNYYCVAYARNGMGTSYGDTINFAVEN